MKLIFFFDQFILKGNAPANRTQLKVIVRLEKHSHKGSWEFRWLRITIKRKEQYYQQKWQLKKQMNNKDLKPLIQLNYI